MDDLAKIRRMSVTDAMAFLNSKPLTADERAQALTLAGRNLEPSSPVPHGIVRDQSRPKWFVTAWLLGASWRQLAALHAIRPQTVMASADTVMPSFERQRSRLRDKMSYEALSAYRAAFLQMHWAEGEGPLAMAEQLLAVDTDKDI